MSFADTFQDAMQQDEFWTEYAILEFTTRLSQTMKQKEISKAELARRMETSQAYIAKVFRGNANLTIASMVKLARCAEMTFHPELKEKEPPKAKVIQLRPSVYHTQQEKVINYG
ncbi:MAG: helix-turn-helix transcriptional regulator [Geobacteraceae bacterium]